MNREDLHALIDKARKVGGDGPTVRVTLDVKVLMGTDRRWRFPTMRVRAVNSVMHSAVDLPFEMIVDAEVVDAEGGQMVQQVHVAYTEAAGCGGDDTAIVKVFANEDEARQWADTPDPTNGTARGYITVEFVT